MKLREQIKAELKEAMKAREEVKLSTLRLLSSEIKNKEIEKKEELSDDEILSTIKTMVKQYKDALKDFISGGREDLVEKQNKELEILEKYLPPQMPEEELENIVQSVIDELGATSADLGKVMGAAMKKVDGKADGNAVRSVAQKLLQ